MAAALLATGIFLAWQSSLLPFGNIGLPGPGFFPFVLGIALSLFALATAARARRFGDDAPVGLGHADVFIVFVSLAGLGLVFERIGAYPALGLFAAVLLLFVARTSFWRAVLAASLGMVAAWVFFKVFLGVQLPAGPF